MMQRHSPRPSPHETGERHFREQGIVGILDRCDTRTTQRPEAPSPAIDGIIEEANDVAGDVDNSSVLDAALIAAAQAVEHYEMTRYGSLIAWARELGREVVHPGTIINAIGDLNKQYQILCPEIERIVRTPEIKAAIFPESTSAYLRV
jgi:ferritin-like metal-binding protein YciE